MSKLPVPTGYVNNMDLSDATLFEKILIITFVTTFLAGMLSLLFVLIMHILMPKKALVAYFKEPYFNAGEIAMFTGFPFAYIRTMMFMRALGFPASGKKRGLENAYKLAPVWYCKVFYLFICTQSGAVDISCLGWVHTL